MNIVKLTKLKDQSYSMKESLRGLRTNLQFCGDDMRVIMFTSTAPDEGKSTVVFELARSFADLGKNVLVVDTDMRKSVLVGRHDAKSREGHITGLSHFLSGQENLGNVIYQTQIPHLYMLYSGPTVPNPTELLEKQYFEKLIDMARERFDYVFIDCAPLGAAIDAAIVAKECDGAVVVVAQGQVAAKGVLATKKQLELAGVKILGVVLNKVRQERSHYGKYYGYGQYYGSYNSNESKSNEKVNKA